MLSNKKFTSSFILGRNNGVTIFKWGTCCYYMGLLLVKHGGLLMSIYVVGNSLTGTQMDINFRFGIIEQREHGIHFPKKFFVKQILL